ncbi:NADP-dependent malic enzyme [Lepagella muris]|jgi:malate dehydrogenase (oxaloacetate-decarboxylating)(NADP+)|uniref:NADP-dependent malic enzyme n=1 Tax=Lepagella muris TaxID=3032870 RepID=A0AC61RJ16_9BACT|nr:NADP-dependent malic enzyme [Lepagella muris]ROT04005.1 NADP-dependent malic enzyme [Muribaculaceae bacterium Isolate-037 (Harlan)]TGY78447.1 NADP-dependent malic enzyme [Lepagella muris]THG53659.1 NADP-dependent malic enzyme [Bacteroidales bacterium]TKC66136.1 NADP-dependent malic enzyme [Bacteroidales bacterium]
MSKVTKEMALDYHEEGKPGKIEIVPTKPYASQHDLALAYSPGVAYPCLEIEKDPEDAYRYTNRGNLVGVISNGTAVLGLGDIGALAGKPVMEGKALLFKIFAGLDAFDIEINEKDPDKIIEIVKAIAPTFGGINLEDIKAPECFKIETRLKEECDIPVMHDDQHGTAIISGAGLLNALQIQGKKIGDIRLVVNGAGAAAISCTRLYVALGVNPKNVVMCDSKGVIRADREGLNSQKREFATTRDLHTLQEAMKDADVFLGLSVADVVTPEMVLSMAPRPIVFALANPNPEIAYDLAMQTRDDIIVATGRSDYPNQINNVIGFPYIFRGALDCGATAINEAMKIAAVHAIADLAKEPVPSVVDEAYGMNNITFGREYILPKALDPRLLLCVAPAVAKAAAQSGIARRPIPDWAAYQTKLRNLMGDDGKMMRHISDLAKQTPKRVVICEGNMDNTLRAAVRVAQEGVCRPVVLGNEEMIEKRAARLGLSLDKVEIVNPRHDREAETRERYAKILASKKAREGFTFNFALDKMFERSYFGMMMVETGDADACLASTYSAGEATASDVVSIIGLQDGYSHFATMHILNTRKGTFFIADTAVNPDADKDALVDIARLADHTVRFFAQEPVMAMLSYSNFGSSQHEEATMVAAAVKELHEKYPSLIVDGEMQVEYALDTKLRDETYPFNTLKGKCVNTLIFPNLTAANCTGKMLLSMGIGSIVGPIQMGLKKPVYFTNSNASEQEICDLVAIAALDAITLERK